MWLVLSFVLGLNLFSLTEELTDFNINKNILEGYHLPHPNAVSDKYNQQNIALRKIKVNKVQPDMDNTIILKLDKGDIDFMVKDLNKDGFNAKAYIDNLGFYFISVDFTGKDIPYIADAAVGLGKYYYVNEVLVSKKVYDEIFVLKNKTNFSKSYATRIGTITGGMNHSPVDITINKIAWTIKGGINLSPVDITIDHQSKTIKGGVNHSPVDLKFEWSDEEVIIEGGANLSPVRYKVNWKKGILEGYSNNSPIKVEFDMKEGVAGENIIEIKGYANYSPVELKFDKISGKLTGGMNYSPVDIKLVNCDLYDFLQYFFLFLNVR
ncbi:MAG: hypothetical protein K6357_00700 [Elusimicrobiota bacterium]